MNGSIFEPMMYRIDAWEPSEQDPKALVACDEENKGAVQWDVVYYIITGPYSAHKSEIECDSLSMAKKIQRAMQTAFNDGRKDMKRQFREFIGVEK